MRPVTAQAVKAMLADGEELALIDVREELIYSRNHLLWARSVPLSRLELRFARLVPRLATRIVLLRTVGPADFVADINAWKGTALGPAHVMKQRAHFPAGNVSKQVSVLYYSGSSTHPGIGVPMCLISAELVVKRVRGDRSASPLPEPARRPSGVPA